MSTRPARAELSAPTKAKLLMALTTLGFGVLDYFAIEYSWAERNALIEYERLIPESWRSFKDDAHVAIQSMTGTVVLSSVAAGTSGASFLQNLVRLPSSNGVAANLFGLSLLVNGVNVICSMTAHHYIPGSTPGKGMGQFLEEPALSALKKVEALESGVFWTTVPPGMTFWALTLSMCFYAKGASAADEAAAARALLAAPPAVGSEEPALNAVLSAIEGAGEATSEQPLLPVAE